MTKVVTHKERLKDYLHSDKLVALYIGGLEKQKSDNGTKLYGKSSLLALKHSLRRIGETEISNLILKI